MGSYFGKTKPPAPGRLLNTSWTSGMSYFITKCRTETPIPKPDFCRMFMWIREFRRPPQGGAKACLRLEERSCRLGILHILQVPRYPAYGANPSQMPLTKKKNITKSDLKHMPLLSPTGALWAPKGGPKKHTHLPKCLPRVHFLFIRKPL